MKHNTFRKNVEFNKIIIIDSLSEKDYHSATRLYEDVNAQCGGEGVAYVNAPDAESFRDVIQMIKDNFDPSINTGFKPIIHIEAHGSAEHMRLADGSTIPWEELAEDLRCINRFMKNSLIVFIGTCFGFHFIYNNHSLNRFTPAYLCITPKEKIDAVDVERASHTFYKNLLSTGDITASAGKVDAKLFYTFNSDYIFHKAFHEAMLRGHKGKTLQERKEKLLSQAILLMKDKWTQMSPEEKSDYLRKARSLFDCMVKNKGALKAYFKRFSIQFMGYADDAVFEEIWANMQINNQGKLY